MAARRPAFGYQVIILLLSFLMVATLLRSLAGFWRLDTPDKYLLIYAVSAVLLSWLYWRVPWLGIALTLLGFVGVGVALRYEPAWREYLQTVMDQGIAFSTALRQFQFDTTFGVDLGTTFLVLAAIGAALLIITESLSKGNAFWSITAGTFIFGTEWTWFYEKSTSYLIGYMLLAFSVWTLGQSALRDASWRSAGRKIGYHSQVVTPLIAVLIVSVLATILPTEFHPINMGNLGQQLQRSFPVLARLRGGGASGRFTLASTGFAPAIGTLGGPVKLDNTVAMQLITDQPLQATAYLRGTTFEVYSGQTWLPGNIPDLQVPKDGLLPASWGNDVLQGYSSITIKPSVSLGNTVFNLLEPMRADGLPSALRADNDRNTWTQRSIPIGSAYTVTSRVPRYSAEQIRKLSTDKPNATFAPYLQLPSTLPKRVGDMARSITTGQDHPYDKAVSIEAYLRGMPYNLEAPAAPAGRDFVDFFLYDLRNGYCTYFATAMAVMLREIDIPSRLVEGFAVPASAAVTETKDSKRQYDVLSSEAHAWVEAYFPGYGWVTFDPTPRSDIPLIDRTAPAPSQSETSGNSTGGGESELNLPLPTPDRPDRSLENADESGGAATAATAGTNRLMNWGLVLLGVVVLLVLGAFRRLRKQGRIPGNDGHRVVQEGWTKTTSLMEQFGFAQKPYETAPEYARSLKHWWPLLSEPAEVVAEDYARARYGPPGEPLDSEATARTQDLWARTQKALLKRYGWRKYFWRRLWWKQ